MLLLSFMFYNGYSQSEYNEGKLIVSACKKLEEDKVEASETSLQKFMEELFVEHNVPDNKKMELLIRLQKKCPLFLKLNVLAYGMYHDWKMVFEKPDMRLKKNMIRKFRNEKNLFYFDTDGGITELEFRGKIWYEKLPDRSYSQLEFHKVAKNKFYLEFQESNNWLKKNFSEVGEKINYEIIDYKDGVYLLSLITQGNEIFFTFHVFSDRKTMDQIEY